MKFTTSYTTTFFVTLLSSLVVQAAPLNERDIFDPPILDPHTGTVWTIGQPATVVWDVSNPPEPITDRFNSLITMRKGGIELNSECDQCNILEDIIMWALVTIASGFDILLGSIPVTVPNVTPADDWSIVCEWKCSWRHLSLITSLTVFGDSGNWSEDFTIKAE